MTRKGGGRDSGKAEARAGTVRRDISEADRDRSAAANLAVESLADFIIPKAAVNPAAPIHSHMPCPGCVENAERSIALEARVKDLEVENAKWRKDWFEVYEPLLAKEVHCCVKTRNGEYWALQKALHARVSRSSAARKE